MLAGLAVVVLLAPPASSPEAWLSLRGSGLLTLQDTATLPAGRVAAAGSVDNRDRDPLGLDLLDGSLAFTLGITPRLEAFGYAVLSRVAALPESPPLAPPPLDLILAPGAATPARPYYALYPETPYVDKRGRARFDEWVRGDLVLGLKHRLSEAAGVRPALAVSADLKLPLRRRLADLQSGSGTGGVDAAARLVGEWTRGRNAWIASAAYGWTGAPAEHDRLIATASGGGPAVVVEERLVLADRIEVGLGYRRRLAPRLAAVLEAVKVFETGRRTLLVDAAPPLDVLAGVQIRRGRGRLAAGLRYHANAPRSGSVRPSPLAGLVDVSDVAPEALAPYLTALGAGGAISELREGSHRVVAARAMLPLPAGARRLPETYRVRSEHQVGFMLVWGWVF